MNFKFLMIFKGAETSITYGYQSLSRLKTTDYFGELLYNLGVFASWWLNNYKYLKVENKLLKERK